MGEFVQRLEEVDRATRPVVASAVQLRQCVAELRAEQLADFVHGRLVLGPAGGASGRERRGEDRLGDSVARRTRERGAIARGDLVDRVTQRAESVGAHRLILPHAAPGARHRYERRNESAPIVLRAPEKGGHGATIRQTPVRAREVPDTVTGP